MTDRRVADGRVAGRRRAAGVIIRDGQVLMVRERGKGPTGRHDGQEYWTLPGGAIEPGESAEEAVIREVAEETGLRCLSARYVYEVPYPSGLTACFRVEVAPGAPRLGADAGLDCDCPRMVGLGWVPLQRSATEGGFSATGGEFMVPHLLMATG